MAMFKADYTTAQTQETLVAGVADKVILVARICFAAAGSGTFILLSDPGGANEQELTPTLRSLSGATLDLVLGRRYGLTTERGKALGLTSTVAGPSTNHSVTIWYELAD